MNIITPRVTNWLATGHTKLTFLFHIEKILFSSFKLKYLNQKGILSYIEKT